MSALRSATAARVGFVSAVLVLAACRSSQEADGTYGSVDEFGRLVAEGGAEPIVGSVQDGSAGAPADADELTPATVAALGEEAQRAPEPVPYESPYLRFGERIIVRELADGTEIVTKPFPLPPGKAAKVVELLLALEPFEFRQRDDTPGPDGTVRPIDPNVLEYRILSNWDQEHYSDLLKQTPAAPTVINLSDMLVVTATAPLLAEFESFIDLFAAGVPQIELEAKIIEIRESDRFDYGVSKVDADTPIFQFGDAQLVKSFDFDLATSNTTEALLQLGALQSGVAFNAVLELIKTWQNVSIETRPKTVVRAGGVARLESTVDIPYLRINAIAADGTTTANIEYQKTGVKLYITPHVVGSKALALDVQLENSQVIGSQAVFTSTSTGPVSGTQDVEVPIVASRTARTIVYLEPGQTLLIGGLTQETSQQVETKVPVLGDIPILGFLFKSVSDEVRKEHVIFAISPRLIQRNDLITNLADGF